MTLKSILQRLSLILLCVATSWTTQASIVIWTNTAGGNWNVAENWWPNQIPSPMDNVFITNAGSYTVVIDSDFGTVDTLVLGGDGGGQRLSVGLSGIYCATSASINPGSELHIAESWLQSLQTDVSGTVTWESGVLSGILTIVSTGVLNLSGEGDKIIQDNASIVNYGAVHWNGGSLLGNDLDFTFDHPSIVNAGTFDIQFEGGTVGLLQSISGPDTTIVFQNAGLLRKTVGPGATMFSSASFENSGTVHLTQGALLFNSQTLSSSSLTSSGLFEVDSGAEVRLGSGSMLFLPGHEVQGEGYFGVILGGPLTLAGEIAGKFDWAEGTWGGYLTIASNGVLNISGSADKYLQDATTITNCGLITWTGPGSVYGEDWDFTVEHPSIFNLAGGVFDIQNDSGLGLASWVGGPGQAFVFHNAGLLRKVAGTGTSVFNGVAFENSGVVQVEQGTLYFGNQQPPPPVWTSSGLFAVQAGAAVKLGAGICTFLPGHMAQGEGYFGVGFGGPLTLNGIVAGRFDFGEGQFGGTLTIATNGALHVAGDSDKYLEDGASVINHGLIDWTGLGGLFGADFGFTPERPSIINAAGAVFEIQNDSSFGIPPWLAGSAGTVSLQNEGTLRKVASSGVSTFVGVELVNSGRLELTEGDFYFDPFSAWVDTGTVNLAIASPANYSQIQSQGAVDLTGTLNPQFANGYIPAAGDTFPLLTYNSANVAFSTINLPPSAGTLYFAATVDSQQLVVEVRRDPVANPDTFTLPENTSTNLNVLANDQNLYGPGAIDSYTQPAHGAVTLNPDNTLHYAPAAGYSGGDSFSYVARNADGRTSSALVSLTITEVNQPPVFPPVPNQQINELAAMNLSLVATDPDQDPLRFSLISGPVGLIVFPGGTVLWTPTETQGPSTNQVIVRVSEIGIPSLSVTQAFSIVVNEVNTAPSLAPLLDYPLSPGQPLNLTFSATDPDFPVNTLTFSLASAPEGASVTSAGVFSWTPTFEQAGTTNIITVKVTDNGVPSLTTTGSFSVFVSNEGLKVQFFTGTNFDNLVLTRVDPQIEFVAPSGDQFSIRWTGQLIPRYSQSYTLSTVSDDGVRVWVNGFLVIDNWTVHQTTTNTGTIALTAGQPAMIKVEYFDATGPAVCRLFWSSTSQALEIVPSSQLVCNGYSDVISSAIYRFTPRIATTKGMDIKGGSPTEGAEVSISNFSNRPWEKWQPVASGEGYFQVFSVHAIGKVLEVNGGSTTNGTRIQVSTETEPSPRQQFKFIDMGQGWFKIQPGSAAASVLQVKDGDPSNGTPVELYQDNGADAQRWRLDRQ